MTPSAETKTMAEESFRDALADPGCQHCGGFGYWSVEESDERIMCGNCRAEFERNAMADLSPTAIYERAAEIATTRFPNGTTSADSLADIVREVINENIALAIKYARDRAHRVRQAAALAREEGK